MFIHPSEGFFEIDPKFGPMFFNSDGKTVYTRYVGEQHVKEDCFNYVPSAKEWILAMDAKEKPVWMTRTMDINVD